MPLTTRGKGEPSSSQTQQPTPAPKDTIEVQGNSEKEEEPVVQELQGPKEKKRELSPEEKMEILYHGMPEIKGYKLITPKPYNGITDVKGFLVQARTHLKFYQSSLIKDYQKVMAISQLLAGRVLLWFEPIIKDYLENYPKESSDITNYIFNDYRYFEDRMRAMFGDPDKEQHAVKQLYLLYQTKLAAEYTTEFNRLAAISNLPENALFYPFYDGLKPQVKDEMYMVPKTGSFKEYTDKAIIANRRTFNRYLEKKGTNRRNNDKGFNSRTKKDKGKP
ncbi:hypothetical protein DL764_009601 [Monosporascus ibericus]|uniref:Retrotransposon gag domain-containing protein n=1 Tax=Monosporascus ibericus TaxID=155417 RepID=A0A4Q4SUL3_9PEZI|nr:hypothetical protein DL764_009601 [Monosporascus ibericus]